MSGISAFTIIIPTRDDPQRCAQLLEQILPQRNQFKLPLQISFLVNDTTTSATSEIEEVIANTRYQTLRPQLFHAGKNYPTVEENIFHTLEQNLDRISEFFLIIGNSDYVDLATLQGALNYMDKQRLDILLIGVLNREMYEGKSIRQLYSSPHHIYSKNYLPHHNTYGPEIFFDAMRDYGPVDYLAYIGCQIYTKNFFHELCQIKFPEPLYSIPIATLELTIRKKWLIGFFPQVVVTRIDNLQYGPNAAQQPPSWWVQRSRTDRGLSQFFKMSVITNSLSISSEAFSILVNSQEVATPRGTSQYLYWNFLYSFVIQLANSVIASAHDQTWRLCASELQNVVDFGKRLEQVDVGLSVDRCALISTWLQRFDVIGDYSRPEPIQQLISATPDVLRLLDSRPGMERWVTQLQS